MYINFAVGYLCLMALSLIIHLCSYTSLEQAVKEVNDEDDIEIEINAWICLSTAFAPIFLLYVLYYTFRKPQ